MSSEKHNAIEKALSILGLFAFENQEMGTIDISKALGYHKATTSRTLILLADYGFLEQNEKSRKYRLGQQVVNLGLAVTRTLKQDLTQIARPYVEDLRNRIGETIILEVVLGKQNITAFVAEGPSNMQLGGQVGEPMPLGVTAGAKAILAFCPENEWDDFLENDLPVLTPKSITDPRRFREQLQKIKKEGVAFDDGEIDEELKAIASPILNIEGRPVAAIDVVGLASRFDISSAFSIVREAKQTASQISKRLYYSDKTPTTLEDWVSSIKAEVRM